ncbi:MAG: hypothetical protein HY664_00785 [Chloroflexi bacterium]|nr:hypothetical protein [Chloroflexota bacterium]
MITEDRELGGIFILHRNSLFAEGMELLLKGVGLGVKSVDVARPQALAEAERLLKPRDIVIVDLGDTTIHPSLSIFQVLLHRPDIVVIGLDPCENRIEVYHKQQRNLGQVEDLVDLIRAL